MNGKKGGKLRRARLFGSSSAVALLSAIACGEVTSLGDNDGHSGGGGSSAAGDGGRLAAAGKAGGGYGGGSAGGGAKAVDGGQIGFGGQGEFGGQGGEVSRDPLPYPLNPTVPIDADCSCQDEASVCNAAGECVPRCEPGGVCATWRVERGILSMLTSGDVLYFILDAQHDDAGNPLPGEAGQQSLWKAHYPELPPSKVATFEGEQLALLAHVDDKTYVWTKQGALLAIAGDGAIVERDLPEDVLDVFVNSTGVFTLAANDAIDRLALAEDDPWGAMFENLVPGAADDATGLNHRIFASDRLWRQSERKLCSFDFADLQAAPHCLDSDNFQIYGATGSRAVARLETGGAHELDVDEQTTRFLWQTAGGLGGPEGTMADGFITGWLWHTDLGRSVLGRIPTEGPAKSPTPLIGQDVVRAMADVASDRGAFIMPPGVTTDAVYWTQWYADSRGPGTSRYIFRAPLPKK